MRTGKKVVIAKNGPYLVSGNLPLSKEISKIGVEGQPEKWVKGKNSQGKSGVPIVQFIEQFFQKKKGHKQKNHTN